MKVTVCFGDVRVLVPCGSGDLQVRDLVREATLRYKKATGKGRDSWVGVRALRASSGGILDPDDLVRDVADDRETLSAECELQLQHNSAPRVGDGASGSSVGTASPDMFRGGNGVGGSMRVPNSESCVEVSEGDIDGAGGLQVRRGSEPTLHQDTLPHQNPVSDPTKRWSAAVVCREESRLMQKVPPLVELPPDPPPDSLKPNGFQRQSNRLSMQFSGPGSGNWLDAAERVQSYGTKSLPRDSRKDPLGQDTTHIPNTHRVEDMLRWVSGVNSNAGMHPVHERPLDLLPEVNGNEVSISGMEVPVSPTAKMPPTTSVQTLSVSLVKGEKGLGFTITTRDNPTGGHCPIYIKNILPKGAAVMDGRLRAGDRLVSVNGIQVSGLNQQQVVTLLRNTPTESTVNIVVERNCPNRTQKVEPQQNPPQYVEKSIGSPMNGIQSNETSNKSPENGRVQSLVHAFNQNKPSPPAATTNGNNSNSSRGRISKSSSKDELSSKDLNSSNAALQEALNSPNSVLGLRNRLILRLDVPVHDSEKAGLGISVKGKVTVGPDPQDLGIFIKSVLHGGAASRDGRLHMNDQLLSVNGVSLVGQSNAEAMETLRRALIHSRPHVHGSISLTIARRTESMDSLARWKDDTPPSNESSTNTTDNSNSNFTSNTVIYNTNGPSHADKENHNKTHSKSNDSNHIQKSLENSKDRAHDKSTDSKNSKRPTIVTINNNSWVNNQSDDSKGYLEIDKDTPEKDGKRDSFEWSRLDGWNPVIDRLTGLRNESYYMATQTDGPVTNGHGNLRHGMGHIQMHRSPPIHNVIIEEDYGTSRVGVGASAGVSGGGGGGGAAPWESGSESGEGAFSRDAIGRRSMSEKRHAAVDAKATTTYKKIKEMKAINAMQVGPALGMRKSSSLESLQTAIQETQRLPRHEPIYTRAHAPLKHWLTDDHPGGATMVRGSPQQSSLSHKKPSLLKSISTMLRFGKPHKKDSELYHRSHPGRSSEKSISREPIERHTKLEERTEEPRINPHSNLRASSHSHSHSRQASGDRGERAERGDKGEGQGTRLYVHPAPPYRMPPARTSPAHMPSAMDSAWGPSGHYVNYDEIQQNLNARREKLSEVQIGQMRRQVHAQRAKAEEESRRAGVGGYHSQRSCREAPRPQSNYYEYETVPNRQPGKLSHYH